ncbi:MAG: hypothetical protein ACLVB5_09070 [Christensenellales bacterium]
MTRSPRRFDGDDCDDLLRDLDGYTRSWHGEEAARENKGWRCSPRRSDVHATERRGQARGSRALL